MRLRGFTLIESILVTSIILLIGIFSSVFGTQFFSTQDTTAAEHTIRESIDRAQTYARSGRFDSDWGVIQVGTEIVVFSGSSYASREASRDERTDLPPGTSVTGLEDVVFERMTGQISTPKAIVVSGSGYSLSLSLSERGVVNRYE